MNVLINYSDDKFLGEQEALSLSAKNVGKFDEVLSFGPSDIDAEFREKNKAILNARKGAGYWLWKSYFIHKVLQSLSSTDRLMYADSGSHFIADATPLLDLCDKFNQDVISFELQLRESAYTKRDAFILLGCDIPEVAHSSQRLASFSIWRASPFSLAFLEEYLSYSCDARIITDLKNVCGLKNYPDFVAHRHDQSIFSLLCKKYELKPFRDPSQFGNPYRDMYKDSHYNQIIEHTRRKRGFHLARAIKNIFS